MQDIKVSIESTFFENIPAPLLNTVLLCSREASEPEIVFADIQKHREFLFGH